MRGLRFVVTNPSPTLMERKYEIFEVLQNGSALKVSVVSGLENARASVRELASYTRNECYAEDTEARQVVLQLNVPRANSSPNAKDLG